MLGSLPPLRALSSYCRELALAIADLVPVEFLSFKKIYPACLYPGRDLTDDHTFPATDHPNLRVKRRLTWWNPMTWMADGLGTKADLLHAQWWSAPLFLAYAIVCGGFRLRGKPVVFTVHNVLPHEPSSLQRMVFRLIFKLGDHFIVHSESNKSQLIKGCGISPERVSQIPHGPLDFHVQGDVDRGAIRKEMGFGPEARVILLFGAIRPYKGLDTALKAFEEVLKGIPEARLL
ncbi:MAG: glycosyltransferase, partial [Thermodesulfobacteriota bacterium]|nr:glycosyltransferase [Thermodesulfobacteriota bacterium]